MTLPPQLASAIATLTARVDTKALAAAATELSDAYRAQRPIGRTYMTSDAHRLAYTATRLPATYAAIHASLSYASQILTDHPFESCLDLGSGPGTAAWAATQIWPNISRLTLVEQDPDLISLGRELAKNGSQNLQSAEWHRADITSETSFPKHDLVICSYAVGELSSDTISGLVDAAWSAANDLLVIIEPGTVPGFTRIRSIRDQLITAGANIVAPCPHAVTCPMADDDWCHFSQRLDRSSLHRQLKSGEMSYEDEKFSYIVVSRRPASLPSGRILRHPDTRRGHTHLSLCTSEGVVQKTVTRSQKADWKRLRRLGWGDAW